MNVHADKAWDVQSKGTKATSAKGIGRELVTLFKNEMSDLNFDYLILFMADVPDTFRIDGSKNTFTIDNIKEKAVKSLRQGLLEEAQKRTKSYIDEEWITDENIDTFLKKVTFVIDERSKAEYIKGIMSINPKYIPHDNVLDGIFNKIRDAQAGKKNNESVEGEIVTQLRDVLYYDRILRSKEIRLMVLNTFINHDVMNTPAPHSFFQLLHRFDGLRQKDIIEDCKLQISILLNDKTYTDEFWNLLDLICDTIEKNRTFTVKQTFDLISGNDVVKNPRLDDYTVQYLISVLKEALQ